MWLARCYPELHWPFVEQHLQFSTHALNKARPCNRKHYVSWLWEHVVEPNKLISIVQKNKIEFQYIYLSPSLTPSWSSTQNRCEHAYTALHWSGFFKSFAEYWPKEKHILWGFTTDRRDDKSDNMKAKLPLWPCVLKYPYFQFQTHSSSEEPQ